MWGYLPTYRNKHGAITRLQVDWKRGVNWTHTQIIGNGALTRLQINLEQAPIRRTRNKLKRHEKAINLEKTAPRRRSHKNWKKRAQQDPAHSRKKGAKVTPRQKVKLDGYPTEKVKPDGYPTKQEVKPDGRPTKTHSKARKPAQLGAKEKLTAEKTEMSRKKQEKKGAKDAAYPRLGQDDQHEVPGRVTAKNAEVNTYQNPESKNKR